MPYRVVCKDSADGLVDLVFFHAQEKYLLPSLPMGELVLISGKLDIKLYSVRDGEEAMAFLHHEGRYADVPEPDLLLLDLNMPKKDGREVLAEIKGDDKLKHIPVVILTASESEADIEMCYNLHANCYVTKPTDLDLCSSVVQSIENFWFTVARLH